MKRSEMIAHIKEVLDRDIMDIPTKSYIMHEHGDDSMFIYAEHLLNEIEEMGMVPPVVYTHEPGYWEAEDEN